MAQTKLFELGVTHIGIENNLLWGWGNSDLIGADYEDFSNGSLNEISDNFGWNADFSIQATFYNKFLLRYTYIKLVEDIPGPIGTDKSYYEFYYYYYDICKRSSDYDYESSHRRNISHIFSLGYPIKYFEYKYESGYYYKTDKTLRIPIIIFVGLAFNKSEIMDLYSEFNYDECDYDSPSYWSIENRNSDFNETKFAFGVSIPFYIQTSLIYTGWDWRLMFGVGI